MDGYERLLEETANRATGHPTDPGVAWFLETFSANPGCRSSLVLTSRLWPETVEGDEFHRHAITRMTGEDVCGHAAFSGLPLVVAKRRAAELYSLLDGHA